MFPSAVLPRAAEAIYVFAVEVRVHCCVHLPKPPCSATFASYVLFYTRRMAVLTTLSCIWQGTGQDEEGFCFG